ncbi:MAG: Spx/MgsR family RNA polymerase-binding regulatory protein [Halieaceae bacterium]
MTQPILYGIPNCDSVRKARVWLETQQIDYQFVDFKNAPPSVATINSWLASVGAAQLVNRRSTTYRQLEEADKKVLDEGDTASVLATHPTLIKRPVLDWKGQISVGFTAIDYADHFFY